MVLNLRRSWTFWPEVPINLQVNGHARSPVLRTVRGRAVSRLGGAQPITRGLLGLPDTVDLGAVRVCDRLEGAVCPCRREEAGVHGLLREIVVGRVSVPRHDVNGAAAQRGQVSLGNGCGALGKRHAHAPARC